MAKKRVKKRTHVGAKPGLGAASTNHAAPKQQTGSRPPKSMVIRVGASEVGQSVSQLVRDVRQMMEPDTATRLKERRSNKLRDYTTMAGPLGVTHLMLFSRSSNGNTNLRLALTPRGPTMHFRVEKYSLCKDIHHSMKRPKTGGSEYHAAPLLVMNNFVTQQKEDADGEQKGSTVPKHLESLATSIFQSLFPPINPTTTSLSGMKRVLLLDRIPQDPSADSAQYILNLRHYAVETRTAKSVPKALRRLDAAERLSHAGQKRKRGGLPNLGKLNDVSDYLLDPQAAEGFTSGSESEPETDAEVEVVASSGRKVQKRKAQKDTSERMEHRNGVEKKGIKLYELGPRLKLRLTKVEEGVCNGKVMWHEYIHKSKEEIKAMDKVHLERKKEKERRRAEQKANVEKKKAEKKANGQDDDEEDEEDEEELDEDMDDDDEWDDEELEDDEVEGDAEAEFEDDEMRDGESNEDEDAG